VGHLQKFYKIRLRVASNEREVVRNIQEKMKTQRFVIGVTVLNILMLMSVLFRAQSAGKVSWRLCSDAGSCTWSMSRGGCARN
jgi:hypothetical protein